MTVAQTRQLAQKTKKSAILAAEFIWKGLFDNKIKRAVAPGKYEEVERFSPHVRAMDRYIC